ncbi:Spo0E family sporulation regulatory protein-aspartic acid phosphatase [Virgibacillus sp. DJP39]|uniref:Spo0E family sporulation regulatory protein-aspartic acid phosphatase n=1 Tax=Virgibacillus sp. DJP39 TaxID=3409790 RepID=UPI003BB67AD0
MDNSNLLKKIEQCREEMILLSCSHSFSSEIVIKCSEKLDSLLNAYHKLENGTLSNNLSLKRK